MKKTTRVSLLVFTVVAAIVAFGVLWYTRPGAPSYVLEEAKARQGVPLLEVTAPATQAPPLEINLDYNAITAKVKENLVEDEGFSSVMAKSVSSSASTLLDTKMDKFRTEFDNKLSEQQDSILKQLNDKIDSNYKGLVSQISNPVAYQNQIDLVNSKIEKLSSSLASSNTKLDNVNKNIDKYAAKVNDPNNYSVDISSYIPQIVDSILPEVTSKILTTIDDNKETIFSEIYDMGNDSISEKEVVAIYNKYRDSIVRDLTPAILDKIEAQVTNKSNVNDSAVASKTLSTESVVVEPSVETTPIKEATETIAKTSPALAKPSFSVEPSVKKIIRKNTINIIAISDGSSIQALDKTSDKTISIPTFTDNPVVTVMDPAEYDEQRQSIRDKAINDILTFIK